jgi:hypothetical protein
LMRACPCSPRANTLACRAAGSPSGLASDQFMREDTAVAAPYS